MHIKVSAVDGFVVVPRQGSAAPRNDANGRPLIAPLTLVASMVLINKRKNCRERLAVGRSVGFGKREGGEERSKDVGVGVLDTRIGTELNDGGDSEMLFFSEYCQSVALDVNKRRFKIANKDSDHTEF